MRYRRCLTATLIVLQIAEFINYLQVVKFPNAITSGSVVSEILRFNVAHFCVL